MKRVLTILLAVFVALLTLSCNDDVAKKAQELSDKIAKAADANDNSKVAELCTEFNEWFSTLSSSERSEVDKIKGVVDLYSKISSEFKDKDIEGEIVEAVSPVETIVKDYFDKMLQAAKDGKSELFENLSDDLDSWAENLSKEEEELATSAAAQFLEAHPEFEDLLKSLD